jgi:glutamate-1-semialdehyde 2,1-aminomutase
MDTFRYGKSEALFNRALAVIPAGIPGHLSHTWLTPAGAYPSYAVSGRGARFTDVDGNEFIDYLCAFGPMILGYSHPLVTRAAAQQLVLATVLSQPPPNVVELAEELVATVTAADWAFFCKNGADVTALATVVARAATGRKKIVLVNGGYHGTAAWMQAGGSPGVLPSDVSNVLHVDWNDVDGFAALVAEHAGDIAGFMAAPYFQPLWADDVMPAEGYWQSIQEICRREGIVLIIDDVRCGFRLDLRGSSEYFGFTPDLVCLSKAIANGHPLSALVGSDALKDAISSVAAIGTFWYEATSFAASLATLRELKRLDAPSLIAAKGEQLAKGIHAAAAEHGYEMVVTGAPAMPSFRIAGDEADKIPLSTDWSGECTRRGAYLAAFHNQFLSTAHTDEDINRTAEIASDAFAELRRRHG